MHLKATIRLPQTHMVNKNSNNVRGCFYGRANLQKVNSRTRHSNKLDCKFFKSYKRNSLISTVRDIPSYCICKHL